MKGTSANRRTSPRRFGIDVDSVVADTLGDMLARINNQFGLSLSPEDVTSYYIDQWLKDLPDLAVLRDAWIWDEAFYRDLPPIPGAQAGVARLVEEGECFFITARPPELHPVTREWLDRHGFPAEVPLFCEEHKAPLAISLGLTHFVEDSPSQATALARAGLTVYLIDYGWNRHIPEGPWGLAADGGERDRLGEVVRVKGWSDIIERLDLLDGGNPRPSST